ncbi:hypothetical protein CA13_21130 [Planctomycetes bacterium CA13]|uniref:Uncharacterized protein n=1 Tax=Novipirellula herctigrandis TaxID=2527986 RepID=A0A5C5Z1A9_9BACT|nr:hypothetical protein CA13_21130 [Planctomycetes bacterium CA13]
MPESKLRIAPYCTDSTRQANPTRQERELDRLTGLSPAKTVSVSLKEFVPLIMDAAKTNRNWLEDFATDDVRIDADLYEVLLAYHHLRRQEAA